MSAEIDVMVGHHDDMKGARWDCEVTPGAQVLLGGRIGLNRSNRHPEKIAHAITARVATMPMTSIAMSAALLSESRKGLKPM